MTTWSRISSDIGGTFTDVAVVTDDGNLRVTKASSTPKNFSEGVMCAIEKAGKAPYSLLPPTNFFVHGATVYLSLFVAFFLICFRLLSTL